MKRPFSLLVLALLLSGCKGTCVQTAVRMTNDAAILKDTTPLREMTVVPGGPSGLKIALIDVDGMLVNANQNGLGSAGENPVELFREKLDTVARAGCYCAVVVRINSPGGGVTASDIMRRDLQAFQARTRLPVVACLMDVAAGGAYYLATACDQIVAHPTTVTGGLGVVLNLWDMQDTLSQINVISRTIRIGKHVDLGSPVHTMEVEGTEILTSVAQEFHQRFMRAVIEARNLGPRLESVPPGGAGEVSLQQETVEVRDELFDGRIFTASRAMEIGLVDELGYVDDALNLARQLGGCPDARAVILHRWRDPARTPYAITPNVPRTDLLPISIPGLERSRLPTFLYMWQPDPTLERWGGK